MAEELEHVEDVELIELLSGSMGYISVGDVSER